MRFVTLINREGGTFKTLDLDGFSKRLAAIMKEAGHEHEMAVVVGDEIVDRLNAIIGRKDCDALLVGGGDGTVSATAARACSRARR